MIFEWLRKKLGIDALQKKFDLVQTEKADLENRVIKYSQGQELIKESVRQSELTLSTRQFLESLNLQISQDSSEHALTAMEAIELVKRYDFKRYSPPADDYPSRVISLAELRKHPEKYFLKLSKGMFNFPVGLNFSYINKILEESYKNCGFEKRKGEFGLQFALRCVLNYEEGAEKTNKLLVQTADLSDLNRFSCGEWVHLEAVDFLANYENLEKFILERPELEPATKERAIQLFRLTKLTYLSALEIMAKSRIVDASELLNYSKPDQPAWPVPADKSDSFKQKLVDSLLTNVSGTSYGQVQELIPIRSKEKFRELCSQRTAEILSKDKERKGLTTHINKPLADYSIGESVVLACYFARQVIQKYEKLDDGVDKVMSGMTETKIGGKCTDYTGLALHYLREYLIPLQAAKFEGWSFGAEIDSIGRYDHCYMKIVHVKPDKSVDVYFVDPTKLAKEGISALKTPKEILKAANTDNLPVLIDRDAEDLLFRPIE